MAQSKSKPIGMVKQVIDSVTSFINSFDHKWDKNGDCTICGKNRNETSGGCLPQAANEQENAPDDVHVVLSSASAFDTRFTGSVTYQERMKRELGD